MKKTSIVIVSLLLFSTLAIPALSQDRGATNIAPVTSYIAVVGQQLQYTTAQVVSGTQATVFETVTIAEITSATSLKLNFVSELQESTGKGTVLANQKLIWQPIPQATFSQIIDNYKPELKSTVIDGLRISYVEVMLQNRKFWLVTDGKQNLFPGIIKVSLVHADHEHLQMQLTKIIPPK